MPHDLDAPGEVDYAGQSQLEDKCVSTQPPGPAPRPTCCQEVSSSARGRVSRVALWRWRASGRGRSKLSCSALTSCRNCCGAPPIPERGPRTLGAPLQRTGRARGAPAPGADRPTWPDRTTCSRQPDHATARPNARTPASVCKRRPKRLQGCAPSTRTSRVAARYGLQAGPLHASARPQLENAH